ELNASSLPFSQPACVPLGEAGPPPHAASNTRLGKTAASTPAGRTPHRLRGPRLPPPSFIWSPLPPERMTLRASSSGAGFAVPCRWRGGCVGTSGTGRAGLRSPGSHPKDEGDDEKQGRDVSKHRQFPPVTGDTEITGPVMRRGVAQSEPPWARG